MGSSVVVLELFLVAARGTLSCSMWGLVPQLGIEPEPSAWGAQNLATGPLGKSLHALLTYGNG